MRQANRTERHSLAELRSTYQFEWRTLLAAVERWQSLQDSERATAASIREAETAARYAHERYRHARNALADCLLRDPGAKHISSLKRESEYLPSLHASA